MQTASGEARTIPAPSPTGNPKEGKPRMTLRCRWNALLCALLLTGCAAPAVKTDAWDAAALERSLPQAGLLGRIGDERVVHPGAEWLAGLPAGEDLTFLGVRDAAGPAFGVLLAVDAAAGEVRYLPLPPGETPLALLADPLKRSALAERVEAIPRAGEAPTDDGVRALPLGDLERRLTSPIPAPQNIFAVAANFPSHLRTDLAWSGSPELRDRLRAARPRVFRKYPPVSPPGGEEEVPGEFLSLPGPFDRIATPARVAVPALSGVPGRVAGHLDYEVEIAAVIGRDLSWEEARRLDDAGLRRAVAGYLLFSDAKVRDPQVMGKVVAAFRDEETAQDNPYRVGEKALDGVLGGWDAAICRWWSYAAGWGRYASAGPFLAAAPADGGFPERLLLGARSYAPLPERGVPPPEGVPTGPLLLRQAVLATTAKGYPDAMIWDLPAVLRSILDPADNALAFDGTPPTLQAGDLVALGTPGGTVISARPWWLLPLAEDLLFWKEPADFYDMFFGPTRGAYLEPADELFLWAEGLGYQHLTIAPPGGELDSAGKRFAP